MKFFLRAFQYRNYRLFWFGQSISLIGTWMQGIAMSWLVYRLTGSAFLLGIVGFAGQLPAFILTPFAGVVADRFNRHHILIITQILSMIQAFILALLVMTGNIHIWYIIFLSVFFSIITAFDIPARGSLLVEMVRKKEDLGNAIALNSAMFNSARLIGPVIAGVLIANVGEGLCFLINAISYLAVIAALFLMKISPREVKMQNKYVFQDLKDGFIYAFSFAPIRIIILLLALVSLMGMPYTVLMPVFAKEILHGGPHTLGFLMGAAGVGALIGAIYMAFLKSVFGQAKIIPLAAGVFGIGLILFSLSRFLWISLLLMLLIGLGMIMQMASSATILQTIIDDDKRGRVMSIYAMAFIGIAPFGSLLAGSLAGKLGAQNTLFASGCLVILGAILFAIKLPALRKEIHPIYLKMGIISEAALGIETIEELSMPPEN
ncbi:MAG: MFS transporter [Armatimonadetes bacterium]|nr:MFS transporter [Armatimonadota bacterium]